MSQYQPPQGPPQGQPPQGQPPQGQPDQFGQASQAPPPQYGQASQAPPPQYGQASQAPPQQPGYQPGYGGPGAPPYGGPVAPSEPGLFDLSFAKPTAPKIAKLGLIALWILGGFYVGGALITFIWMLADGSPSSWLIMQALGQLLMAGAIALVLIVLGRLFIELVLSQVRTEGKSADK